MLTITAPAKINLALDVICKRSDGYHEIDTVMQSIALADQLTLESHPGIELVCSNKRLPTDHRNLAWKAAKLLQEVTGTTQGVKIYLIKNIPVAAGLAGGSSDAAAVLIALNSLWELALTTDELMKIGVKLGADVPFCIHRGTARARGIGEKLSDINSKLSCSLLLVKPNLEVSTVAAYNLLRPETFKHRPQIDQVIAALEKGDLHDLSKVWGNVFESEILKQFPMVAQTKEIFQRFGLTTNLMSGSGPSIFALAPPEEVIPAFVAAIPSNWFCCLTRFEN